MTVFYRCFAVMLLSFCMSSSEPLHLCREAECHRFQKMGLNLFSCWLSSCTPSCKGAQPGEVSAWFCLIRAFFFFFLTETLRSYFSQYGEVVDCVIMKDKTTNQSRGFGFVKFKDPNCVGTVLASRPHTLDGRNVSCCCVLVFFFVCFRTCCSRCFKDLF